MVGVVVSFWDEEIFIFDLRVCGSNHFYLNLHKNLITHFHFLSDLGTLLSILNIFVLSSLVIFYVISLYFSTDVFPLLSQGLPFLSYSPL